jgi:hypothetical protein
MVPPFISPAPRTFCDTPPDAALGLRAINGIAIAARARPEIGMLVPPGYNL